ncbi:MAG TPA: TonB-dependent receptor [Bacteroidales bacterium]|jgi:hypothetical protein|nr:TonB-dependent receptor [Bacteroidales bacterium]HPZ61213.1 TonB-dependent receptor [Bacteroidales bacterium]HQD58506.1 TonB-dependent receptor [Bacteroidales bacterium]
MQYHLIFNLRYIIITVLFLFSNLAITQNISGYILDDSTKEPIPFVNIRINHSNKGSTTDFNGRFLIDSCNEKDTFCISAIGYQELILKISDIPDNRRNNFIIYLEKKDKILETIEITSKKIDNNQIALLNSIKDNTIITTGVSQEIIAKYKEASCTDIVKRLPGISMQDQFIIVRGLSARYNNIYLNDVRAPSIESDQRSFSFDLIPAQFIDYIHIYKSPFSDFSSLFGGALLKIKLREEIDKNSFTFSLGQSINMFTTFKDFQYYGEKGSLLFPIKNIFSLPGSFPTSLANSTNENRLQLDKMLNRLWIPTNATAPTNTNLSMAYSFHKKIKKVDLYSNFMLYSNSNFTTTTFERAGYNHYNTFLDKPDTNYHFRDTSYESRYLNSALANISTLYNNNSFNLVLFVTNITIDKITWREGKDYYGGTNIRGNEMLYKKRNIFLGELSGKHKLRKNTDLQWFGGITTTSMLQPDNKRLTWIRNDQQDNDRYGQYALNFMFTANPAMSGRLFQNLNENEYSAGAKLTQKININEEDGNINFGVFTSNLTRSFEARNFGYRISNVMQFDWDIAYLPTEQIFTDDYINTSNGIILDETTNPSDSYTGNETNYAVYIAWQQKIYKFSWYLGLRAEYNTMRLNSHTTDATNPPIDDDKVNYENSMLFFSPSLAIGYDINEKMKIKFNYGKTYDKPQFREIAPYAFYDYEAKAVIIGNPDLYNATINHFNLRYEYYFSLDELFSFDIFYKTFHNAIEYKIIPAGTGLQYSYQNVPAATAIGLETEIHKKILPCMFVIANVALIKSNVMFKNENIENDRMLQGQSPYVVNGGLFFQFDSLDLQASILYNVFGKRIAFVGDPYTNNPDIYELPYHNLKFNISKTFAKKFMIDFQINNILGKKKEFIQIVKSNTGKDVQMTTEKSIIPRIYSFKFTYKI